MGYRGIGHMGNGDTGGMGLMGYEPHGQWVQGVWATWAMGTHGAVDYRGMGYSGYEPHGQWRHMGQ